MAMIKIRETLLSLLMISTFNKIKEYLSVIILITAKLTHQDLKFWLIGDTADTSKTLLVSKKTMLPVYTWSTTQCIKRCSKEIQHSILIYLSHPNQGAIPIHTTLDYTNGLKLISHTGPFFLISRNLYIIRITITYHSNAQIRQATGFL